jgi:fructose/tagatose bisphosphate aldolase
MSEGTIQTTRIAQDQEDLLALLDGSITLSDNRIEVLDESRLRATIHRLAEVSALESGTRQGLARYIVRMAALALNIIPSSIHELYMARGRGEVLPTFTVPAINLRALSFDAARAVFHAAHAINAGAFIFEIARSEMGYTDQSPSEYATSVLAAAIVEGHSGPVFIQGDHFQVSAKRYASQPETELQAVRDLTREAIRAGFFNIDIDTSTLVDLDQPTVPEQQAVNSELSAMFTAFIRSLEPAGVTISIGGEIGEVGGQNSTEGELRAYMDSYLSNLDMIAAGAAGLSKISIQTGTSHGGVVLPDGSIAKVSVDFDTLLHLSRLARNSYQLGGAVQHGASTLPESAFSKFVASEATEVHLATNFQNMLFDRLPDDLRAEMYAYLDKNQADQRKPDQTDDQFYYKTRKYAIGPYKTQLWNMPDDKKEQIRLAWRQQFEMLFDSLALKDTRQYVEQTVEPVVVLPRLRNYLGETNGGEKVSDLAD